jgi:hypothetical protein
METAEYSIGLLADVNKIEYSDNQDGSHDCTYIMKVSQAVVKDKFKKIYVKADKKSKSKRQRFGIINLNDTGMDDQDYYDMVMDKIYAKLPEIVKGVL